MIRLPAGIALTVNNPKPVEVRFTENFFCIIFARIDYSGLGADSFYFNSGHNAIRGILDLKERGSILFKSARRESKIENLFTRS